MILVVCRHVVTEVLSAILSTYLDRLMEMMEITSMPENITMFYDFVFKNTTDADHEHKHVLLRLAIAVTTVSGTFNRA